MTMKLTDREIAIAQGLNPDAPQADESSETKPEAKAEKKPAESKGAGNSKEAESGKDARPAPESKPDESAKGSWLTADVKSQAKELGLDAEDLAEFESAAEFKRAVKVLEKQRAAANPGKQPEAKPDDEEDDDVDPEEMKKAGFDENSIKLAKVVRKLKDSLKKMEGDTKAEAERREAREYAKFIGEFHEALDALDPELFGKAYDDDGNDVELEADKDANRRKIFEKYARLHNEEVEDAKKAKRAPKLSMKRLLAAARDQVFAKELLDREKSKLTSDLKKQSSQRRPVSSSVPRTPVSTADAKKEKKIDANAIANDPDLVRAFDKYQEENGRGK